MMNCAICLELITTERNKCVTECNHIFHTTCFANCNGKCPLCRTDFTVKPTSHSLSDDIRAFVKCKDVDAKYKIISTRVGEEFQKWIKVKMTAFASKHNDFCAKYNTIEQCRTFATMIQTENALNCYQLVADMYTADIRRCGKPRCCVMHACELLQLRYPLIDYVYLWHDVLFAI